MAVFQPAITHPINIKNYTNEREQDKIISTLEAHEYLLTSCAPAENPARVIKLIFGNKDLS